MIYGYARVSTPQQSIDRQIRNIRKKYPDAKIYSEAWTGTEMTRPEWAKLMRTVKSGDVVVFDSVSRMARTATAGVETYKDLMNRGVKLEFIKEPHINTAVFQQAKDRIILPEVDTGQVATDKLIGSIFGAVQEYMGALVEQQVMIAFEQAEKEVKDLRVRTKEGIETARLNGKMIGRPKGSGHVYTTEKEKKMLPMIRKLSKDFEGTLSDGECMEVLKLARGTYYKYKRKIKDTRA